MERVLAPLRRDLDFFPSPDRNRPGLVIQDRSRISNHQMLVPPPLVIALELFNGQNTDRDLRQLLTQITGDLQVSDLAAHLENALSQAGFLEDDRFAAMKDAAMKEWREAEHVYASHSGPLNYPEDGRELREQFDGWFGTRLHAPGGPAVQAIAAPHASPGAARRSYVAAYRELARTLTPEQAAEKTFVILGTSHYGEIDRLGTTRKSFVTPAGTATVHLDLLNKLRAEGGAGVLEEDHYFQLEHSVEFQVVFLQYLFGPSIRILPLLCGSYAKSIYLGGAPEQSDEVRRYLDALRSMEERHGDQLIWVLGVDMAHIGKRYDDEQAARAYEGRMQEVEALDRKRIAALQSGDTEAFWNQVQEGRDPLKWCGSAPFYTYLRAVPHARGELLDYEHWQIDDESVVSYGALRFAHSGGA